MLRGNRYAVHDELERGSDETLEALDRETLIYSRGHAACRDALSVVGRSRLKSLLVLRQAGHASVALRRCSETKVPLWVLVDCLWRRRTYCSSQCLSVAASASRVRSQSKPWWMDVQILLPSPFGRRWAPSGDWLSGSTGDAKRRKISVAIGRPGSAPLLGTLRRARGGTVPPLARTLECGVSCP